MKQLESYVNEKLRITKDNQYITVESFIDALNNYGDSIHLKDIFGRGRAILEPSEYLTKDEEGYGGSKIFEIYWENPIPSRNIPGQIILYGMHHTTRLDIFVKCEIGEDEKLHSLFRPGMLETIYKYLIEHKR
jgi:hypothetical protein